MPVTFYPDLLQSGLLSGPTPATVAGATVTIDPATGEQFAWTAAETETVNISGTHYQNQRLMLRITNDATPRVITFGTGFRSIGTLTGTASKTAVVSFVSDGTDFWEVSRAEAIT